MKRRFYVFLFFCFYIFCSVGGIFAKEAKTPLASGGGTQSLSFVMAYFEEFYYKEVDSKELAEKILKGGVGNYDRYCHYFNKIEAKELSQNFKGHFYGIGAVMGQKTDGRENHVVIMSVIPGNSAAEAGLKSGDYLVSVSSDGKKENAVSAEELSVTEAVNLIRGEEGTAVFLSVKRNGKLLNFKLKRRDVKMENLTGKMAGTKIGYVQIKQFQGRAGNHGEEEYDLAKNFQVLVSSLQAQGARSLILDLRDNPGGLLDLAVDIANLFKKDTRVIFNKSVVYLQYRSYADSQDGNYGEAGKFKNLKTVVLVNDGSASASEIVAAYLKNYCGAKVVGTRTFGKGVGQGVFPFADGSALILTTFQYFVGENKISVNGVGVEPDIKISNPDLQLQRAIKEAGKLIQK